MINAHLLKPVKAGLITLLLTTVGYADDPLEKPFRLESGGKVIDVNTGHAAPYLYDFDGDGVRDLLVGEFGKGSMTFEGKGYARGRLRIYRNTGTEKKPRYDGFEWFKAGGEIAQVPITCCVSFCPEIVDWDGDGDMDMLTGSYPGHLYLYRNNGKGEYAAAEMLKNAEGKHINPGTSSNPRAHDWDGDGDLDLVIANTGYIHIVRNVGTRKAPRFEAKATRVKFRSKEIRLRGRLGVEMADWNGDGRADMLIGQSAGVTVLFDSATKGAPVFKKSQVLVRSKGGEKDAGQEGKDYPGDRLKLHVADYNGDGLDDLLVGDVNCPTTTKVRASLTEQQRREYKAFKKRTAAVRREIDGLVADRDLALDQSAKARMQARIMELLNKLGKDYYSTKQKYEETTDGGAHGHVWVYLRKNAQNTQPKMKPLK